MIVHHFGTPDVGRLKDRQPFIGGLCEQGSGQDAFDLMFEENNPAGVKAFMQEAGLIENVFRLPVVPVSGGLQSRIAAFVKNFK